MFKYRKLFAEKKGLAVAVHVDPEASKTFPSFEHLAHLHLSDFSLEAVRLPRQGVRLRYLSTSYA